MPKGSFYLWVPVPEWAEVESEAAKSGSAGDDSAASAAWVFARALAEAGGMLVSPGDLYGADAGDHVRIAVVQPDERIELVAARIEASDHPRIGGKKSFRR
jgi:aspartate/methionine/tyrosine aminotransferase